MAEALDRLFTTGPSAWTKLGRGPQLLLIAAALLAPLLFFGTQWMSEGQYVPLFTSLPPEEGGAILAQLKASKTPYRIGGAGDQILVPADKVSEARLRLAMQGLPVGGGVGFEVFDRPSLGVSDFAQRLNYQRALQGELARTIGQLREVTRAAAQMNFDQMERTEEKFDPNAVMRQKTRSTETTKGRTTTPIGTQATTGTTTPPGGDPAAAAAAQANAQQPNLNVAQNDGNRESESVTYEVSRIVAKTLTSPGEIRRLSVAVVLNAPARPAGADPKTPPPTR